LKTRPWRGWGAPRIHGALLVLGFRISPAIVSRYLPAPGTRTNPIVADLSSSSEIHRRRETRMLELIGPWGPLLFQHGEFARALNSYRIKSKCHARRSRILTSDSLTMAAKQMVVYSVRLGVLPAAMQADRKWVERNLGFDPIATPPPALTFTFSRAAQTSAPQGPGDARSLTSIPRHPPDCNFSPSPPRPGCRATSTYPGPPGNYRRTTHTCQRS
jgi:hypothetical protein